MNKFLLKSAKILFICTMAAIFTGFKAAEADKYAPLTPFGLLSHSGLLDEGSAFLKSPNLKDVYWSVNDSNNAPALMAFDKDWKIIVPDTDFPEGGYKGITVREAKNNDWEALAADDKGNIIICDAGNNKNNRRDLAVYIVPEPDPYRDIETRPAKKVSFEYPDQFSFPPKKPERNFDSEACFYSKGRLYLLTKHRGDTRTKLYMFPSLDSDSKQKLKLIGSAEIGGMATDAAISPSGERLAVLTYYGAYLFEKGFWKKSHISGKKKSLPFSAGQCEGITFEDEDTLTISNERGELFRIDAKDFK